MKEDGIEREVWNKKHIKRKVVGSRMRCAGHVKRMGEETLSKTLHTDEGGRQRRGRLKLLQEDRVKRDLRR